MAARIRKRAIIVGLILAALLSAVTPFNNAYRHATPLGGGHFPLAPFCLLFVLTVVVVLVGRRRRPPLLNGRELLTIWFLMAIVSGIAYTGLVRTFFINVTAPYHYATVGNRWQEVLQPLLPRGWYPQDSEAIAQLYNGLDGGHQMGWLNVIAAIPWQCWLAPLLVWGGFVFLCYWVMLCLVNIFSQQWIANERMNFPLLRVLQMMEDALAQQRFGRFVADRFLLAGLLLTVFLHLLNGLHVYFPAVPQIPTLILAGPYFPKHGLFSGFHKLKIYIYPAFIGFAFLAARQISFSFWIFYLMGALATGALAVLGYAVPPAALGVNFGPTLTYPEETQMIGAYAVFFFFLLWLARHHLRQVLRQALGGTAGPVAAAEYLSLRLSAWGFVLGVAGLSAWCVLFGMPLRAALPLLGVFFMVMLVASRVVCQGGVAYFTLNVAPTDGLLAFFGSNFFTNVGLLMAAVMQKVLFVDLRESIMPSMLHGAKVNEGNRSKNLFLVGLAVTVFLGAVISAVAMLALCYKYGVRELGLEWATRTTLAVYENVQRLVEEPSSPRKWVLVFSLLGAAVMLALVLCYHRFYWWPIHPIGYLTTYSSAMRILWFSFMVGWLCNHLSLHYGGVKLFRQARMFFIGLIIGDFLMGGTWALVGLFTSEVYRVLPD